MTNYNACVYEIYQNQQQFGRWYCRVIAGNYEFSGATNSEVFEQGKEICDLPLNGNGENKAVSKIKDFLRRGGLELLILKQNKNTFVRK